MSKKDLAPLVSSNVVRMLQRERKRRGISLNALAAKSSLSRTMISYVERGMRHPTLDTLLRVAQALEIDLWKLLKQASDSKKASSD